jgi:isopentenyldiphosphate isomerase
MTNNPKDGIILEVVDANDNVIGQATRQEIHEKGLLHREIHVWFITPKGEIVFQHRAKDKDTYPDLLDATVGGHVEVGDSYEKTAIKEMEEETGIRAKVEDLHFLKKFFKCSEDKVTGMINNTVRSQYAYVYSGKLEDLHVEEGKALGFEAWPIDQLSHLSEDNQKKFISSILQPDVLGMFEEMKRLI